MPKRLTIEAARNSHSSSVKDEPSTPPSSSPPPEKKPRNASSEIKSSPPKDFANGIVGSVARTKKGMYMEMLFEAGIKAVNKQEVQAQTGLTPAQQQEMIRKDKGALRKAVGAFVAGL